MKKIKNVLVFCFCSLIIFAAHAGCKVNIFYVNGIMNKPYEANQNFEGIKNYFGNFNYTCYQKVLYNKSHNFLLDTSELYAFKVKYEEGLLTTAKNIWLGYMASTIGNVIKSFSKEGLMPNDLKDNIDEMVLLIKPYLDKNQLVILVAHSEGNLFALEIMQRVKNLGYSDGMVQTLHLASPVKIPQKWKYTDHFLLKDDLVIKTLSGVNTPNLNAGENATFLGHGLLLDYLRDVDMEYFNPKESCYVLKANKEKAKLWMQDRINKGIAISKGQPVIEIMFDLQCQNPPPSWYN